jgi:hypothetical protein
MLSAGRSIPENYGITRSMRRILAGEFADWLLSEPFANVLNPMRERRVSVILRVPAAYMTQKFVVTLEVQVIGASEHLSTDAVREALAIDLDDVDYHMMDAKVVAVNEAAQQRTAPAMQLLRS